MAMVMFWSHTFPSPLLPCTPCATPGGICGLGTPQPSCSTEGQQSSMEATAGGKCHHTLSPCLSGDPALQQGRGCSLSQHSTAQPSACPVTRTWLTPCAMMQTCAPIPASRGASILPTSGMQEQPSHHRGTWAGPCPFEGTPHLVPIPPQAYTSRSLSPPPRDTPGLGQFCMGSCQCS